MEHPSPKSKATSNQEKDLPKVKEANELRLEGNGLYTKGDVNGALNHYIKAFEVNEKDSAAASNAAHCILSLGKDPLRAEYYADKAVDLRPDWAKAYYRKGCALVAQSKYIMALASFQVALKMEPGDKSIETAYRATAELAERCAASQGSNDDPAKAGGFDKVLVNMMREFQASTESGPIKNVNKWQRNNYKSLIFLTPFFNSLEDSYRKKDIVNIVWGAKDIEKIIASSDWVDLVEKVLKSIHFNNGRPIGSKILEALVREPWRASKVLNGDISSQSTKTIETLLKDSLNNAGVESKTSILQFIIPEHPIQSAALVYHIASKLLINENNNLLIAWSFQVDEKTIKAAGASEFLVGLCSTNRTYVCLIDPVKKAVFDFYAIWDALIGSRLTAQKGASGTVSTGEIQDAVVLKIDSVKNTPKHKFEKFFNDVAGGGPNGDLLFYTGNDSNKIIDFVSRVYASASLWDNKKTTKPSEPKKELNFSESSNAIRSGNSEILKLNSDSLQKAVSKEVDLEIEKAKELSETTPIIEMKTLDEYYADEKQPKPSSKVHKRKKSVTFDVKPPQEFTPSPYQSPNPLDDEKATFPHNVVDKESGQFEDRNQNGQRAYSFRDDIAIVVVGLALFAALMMLT